MEEVNGIDEIKKEKKGKKEIKEDVNAEYEGEQTIKKEKKKKKKYIENGENVEAKDV